MRDARIGLAVVAVALAGAVATPSVAVEKAFPAGSLIVPMDTTYQDRGMLRAYGLVHALLAQGIPLDWAIASGKSDGGTDFQASAEDVRTSASIAVHGYRGGPFVVDAAHAARALSVVTAWQTANPEVAVHRATAPFVAEVARELTSAPTIAVFAGGQETEAFDYLNAAGIPMRNGAPWPSKKDASGAYACPGPSCCPDCLGENAVAGPTTVSHTDGALFDGKGVPRFCQIVAQQTGTPSKMAEVVAELRAFAQAPVHVFAQGPAALGLENGGAGFFLTTRGLVAGGMPGSAVTRHHPDAPVAQADGSYETTGGNSPSFALAAGSAYDDSASVLMSSAGAAPGTKDVLLSGHVDGDPSKGRVTFLGGNTYDTKLPMSSNPKTQGTRYFLNSLFEASCARADAAPVVEVSLDGRRGTNSSAYTFSVCWENAGPGLAFDGVLAVTLPPGATLVSASDGGVQSGSQVVWSLGTLAVGSGACPSLTVDFGSEGSFAFAASVAYSVGINRYEVSAGPPLGVRFGRVNLLRFATVSTDPLSPSRAQIFTGTWPQATTLDPLRDLEVVAFSSGDAFPSAVGDASPASSPLVFYQLDGSTGDTLRVSKAGGVIVVTY